MEMRGRIFSGRKGGRVGEENIPNLIQTPDLETRVAILRESAEQVKVTLPTDVALYIAQNVRSNARALQVALIRLLAHSSLTGTEITLTYARRVLKNFIDPQACKVTAEPLQKLVFQQFGTEKAKIRRQDPTATDRSFVFCLLKTRDARKISRVRQELEVNMREREREQLARRDAYERDLERRAKKRKRG
jgi:chromosomal replication initiation ATPase DnaA